LIKQQLLADRPTVPPRSWGRGYAQVPAVWLLPGVLELPETRRVKPGGPSSTCEKWRFCRFLSPSGKYSENTPKILKEKWQILEQKRQILMKSWLFASSTGKLHELPELPGSADELPEQPG
jgi:hypothetical protein